MINSTLSTSSLKEVSFSEISDKQTKLILKHVEGGHIIRSIGEQYAVFSLVNDTLTYSKFSENNLLSNYAASYSTNNLVSLKLIRERINENRYHPHCITAVAANRVLSELFKKKLAQFHKRYANNPTLPPPPLSHYLFRKDAVDKTLRHCAVILTTTPPLTLTYKETEVKNEINDKDLIDLFFPGNEFIPFDNDIQIPRTQNVNYIIAKPRKPKNWRMERNFTPKKQKTENKSLEKYKVKFVKENTFNQLQFEKIIASSSTIENGIWFIFSNSIFVKKGDTYETISLYDSYLDDLAITIYDKYTPGKALSQSLVSEKVTQENKAQFTMNNILIPDANLEEFIHSTFKEKEDGTWFIASNSIYIKTEETYKVARLPDTISTELAATIYDIYKPEKAIKQSSIIRFKIDLQSYLMQKE